MTGYSIGEPYFTKNIEKNFAVLTKSLKDPKLPLMELKVSFEWEMSYVYSLFFVGCW